jgi:hypothetical protein
MHMAKVESLGNRKRRKRGSLGQLRGALWESLLRLEALVQDDDPDVAIRAANSLGVLSRAYIACLETGDIESRLSQLESRLETTQHTNGWKVYR